MDPERASHDDLDVRLHWPGAHPEGAEDEVEAAGRNGRAGARTTARTAAKDRGSSAAAARSSAAAGAREKAAAGDEGSAALLGAVQSLASDIDEYSERLVRLERATTSRLQSLERHLERTSGGLEQVLEAVEDIRGRLPSGGADAVLLEKLEALSRQIEVLRRRLPVRARSEPEPDPEAAPRPRSRQRSQRT